MKYQWEHRHHREVSASWHVIIELRDTELVKQGRVLLLALVLEQRFSALVERCSRSLLVPGEPQTCRACSNLADTCVGNMRWGASET